MEFVCFMVIRQIIECNCHNNVFPLLPIATRTIAHNSAARKLFGKLLSISSRTFARNETKRSDLLHIVHNHKVYTWIKFVVSPRRNLFSSVRCWLQTRQYIKWSNTTKKGKYTLCRVHFCPVLLQINKSTFRLWLWKRQNISLRDWEYRKLYSSGMLQLGKLHW